MNTPACVKQRRYVRLGRCRLLRYLCTCSLQPRGRASGVHRTAQYGETHCIVLRVSETHLPLIVYAQRGSIASNAPAAAARAAARTTNMWRLAKIPAWLIHDRANEGSPWCWH